MNLERCGAVKLILRKLRNPLEEIVSNSHRPHGVGTGWSRTYLVELVERRHDRTLRRLDHGEIGRKGGRSGSRGGRGSRLVYCLRIFLWRTSCEERACRSGQNGMPEFPSTESCRCFILAWCWP